MSKSQYPVTIQSNPPGATVCVKNKKGVTVHKAITPATLSLEASSGFFSPERYTFQFDKNGYHQGSCSLSAGMDPWYIGNVIFGGLIGIVIVDPLTGAMWKLDDTVYGNLSQNHNAQNISEKEAPLLASMETSKKLKDLKDLKDNGLITPQEYETKRKALVETL
ncbi:SHOCT domain-containing protein [Tichowtungia aerotolerans]|uniref:SHOCT domain-containing protein n=1 Tax=Tichowtungia aerotolerans TaxID=2697043 RepID=A0A6P1M6L6_9BACT|nr:SHOCT domain-containing protein [Tichowtungia aerotolerans]QHI70439.1 hypothetical protein GT409_13660 [Tichowtungia aerotolerans]